MDVFLPFELRINKRFTLTAVKLRIITRIETKEYLFFLVTTLVISCLAHEEKIEQDLKR